VFTEHERVGAGEIFEYLKGKDIFVRHWDAPRIGNFLRITVGTREQMEKVVDALEVYLNRFL